MIGSTLGTSDIIKIRLNEMSGSGLFNYCKLFVFDGVKYDKTEVSAPRVYLRDSGGLVIWYKIGSIDRKNFALHFGMQTEPKFGFMKITDMGTLINRKYLIFIKIKMEQIGDLRWESNLDLLVNFWFSVKYYLLMVKLLSLYLGINMESNCGLMKRTDMGFLIR